MLCHPDIATLLPISSPQTNPPFTPNPLLPFPCQFSYPVFFFSGILGENQFGNIDFDMSRRKKVNAPRKLSLPVFLVVLVLISFSRRVDCDQDDDEDEDNGGYNNPAAQQLFTQLVSNRISNFTSIFKEDISKNFGFCITDVLVSLHFIFFLAEIVIIGRICIFF